MKHYVKRLEQICKFHSTFTPYYEDKISCIETASSTDSHIESLSFRYAFMLYAYQKDTPCTKTARNCERYLKGLPIKSNYLEDSVRSLTFAM